ncbi:MAG: ABC transporter ATP-binding protein [Rhodospirillaceae bacterium]|nr:ABC transporter ATP-binding protein [Rhodospirillaceae bacterium]
MLRIENLTYRIGPRVLLENTSAAINAGHRVGLVGRNGTGKTTLLKLITGALQTDGGTIEYPSRWSVGITSQEAPHSSASLIDTVMAADKELVNLLAEAETATNHDRIAAIHTRLHDKDAYTANARAARILAGLGFDEAAQQKPCSDYSGGWRMRVALAGLLFTQPDLLLLDEPTNHLDLEATIWLEDYLRTYPGTILLVSHDRGLLNRVPEEILHLENGKMTLYQGGYDRFEATRRMQLEQNEKLRAKQTLRRAEIQKFIDRFKAKASKAKQAQSRVKMLERMQPIAEHHEEGSVNFQFPEPDELSPPLFSINKVVLGYDGKPVLSNLSLRLDTDDRIALIGANGNGKSTFIKLLAGKLEPMAGDVTKSGKLRVGYFAQHQAEELELSVTPLVEMARRRPNDSEQQIRNHLGRFSFSKPRAETKIGNLSGGEKARLLFALMTLTKPHILLLDEPTNHLDMDSRQALVEAINNFDGAVVLISHDPHVIELTVDRFWLVHDGKVTPYEGDMEDYRALLLGTNSSKNNAAKPAPVQSHSATIDKIDKKESRKQAADRRNSLKPMKTQIDRAETKMNKLTAERDKLKESLADPKLYEGPHAQIVEIQTRLGYLENEISQAEEAWLKLQEDWDRAQSEAAA